MRPHMKATSWKATPAAQSPATTGVRSGVTGHRLLNTTDPATSPAVSAPNPARARAPSSLTAPGGGPEPGAVVEVGAVVVVVAGGVVLEVGVEVVELGALVVVVAPGELLSSQASTPIRQSAPASDTVTECTPAGIVGVVKIEPRTNELHWKLTVSQAPVSTRHCAAGQPLGSTNARRVTAVCVPSGMLSTSVADDSPGELGGVRWADPPEYPLHTSLSQDPR